MDEQIRLDAIFDKHLNFLIGSGASVGLLPTLALNIRDEENNPYTVETLASAFQEGEPRHTALFMHYYLQCVLPAQKLSLQTAIDQQPKQVFANYRTFVGTLLQVLARRRPFEKKVNIFTTNYDPCITLVADELIQSGTVDFVLNDGARGFTVKQLQARYFNTLLSQTGIFEREQVLIPQINLVHLHGSIYWKRNAAGIQVDYAPVSGDSLIAEDVVKIIAPFSAQLGDATQKLDGLITPDLPPDVGATFMEAYRKLPIVNPTKWKFHETVFEEQYYQMLRLLSYELEKPNAVLITFGFSFADEHVLNLIKRSLANPKLEVFVCCYDQAEFERLHKQFEIYQNVRFVGIQDGPLNFTTFNDRVFSLSEFVASPTQGPAKAGA
jgi:hypothetical protein